MRKYHEEIIVIECNDNVRFSELIEGAMKQGYVFHGSPMIRPMEDGDSSIVQMMIKQSLDNVIKNDGSIQQYIGNVEKVRAAAKKTPQDPPEKPPRPVEEEVDIPF